MGRRSLCKDFTPRLVLLKTEGPRVFYLRIGIEQDMSEGVTSRVIRVRSSRGGGGVEGRSGNKFVPCTVLRDGS